MFSENSIRTLQERQKDLRRDAENERLVKEIRSPRPTQHGATERRPQKHLPLWTRIWMFL